MDDTLTLAALRERGIRFRADEAVALAQQLMCGAAESSDAHPPYGLLSEDTVAIGPDGRVYCCGSAVTPSVAEVGILLQDLLEEPGSAVPGGLRYAIGRALLEVEAPPFDSLEEFAAALRRFEKEPPPAVLTSLYSRAVLAASREADDLPAAYRGTERRRHMPSSTELRRQLRDTDRRLFEASRPVAPIRTGGRSQRLGRAPFTAGILACSALIAAGGLGYTGGLAYTRVAGERLGGHRLLPATRSTPDRAAEPIEATPIRTEIPLPLQPVYSGSSSRTASRQFEGAGRRSQSGVTQRFTRPSRQVRVARAAAPAERDFDRQRTRSVSSKNDDRDRGVIARLRFEWDNPFKRSH